MSNLVICDSAQNRACLRISSAVRLYQRLQGCERLANAPFGGVDPRKLEERRRALGSMFSTRCVRGHRNASHRGAHPSVVSFVLRRIEGTANEVGRGSQSLEVGGKLLKRRDGGELERGHLCPPPRARRPGHRQRQPKLRAGNAACA